MMIATTNTPWAIISAAMLLLTFLLYCRGWQRLRGLVPTLGTGHRLGMFSASLFLLALIMIWPLDALSGQLLSARTLQKVLLCMFVPPLLWAACPVHAILLALPRSVRHALTRALLRESPARRILRAATQPSIVWLVYVCAFLAWHDPAFANWMLQSGARRNLFLWLLLGVAMLYWSHVTRTGLRLHRAFTGWGVVVYLLAVEVSNMLAGVSIAFSSHPIYAYYADIRPALLEMSTLGAQIAAHVSVLEDQMLSGAMTWVTGSIVYISAIMVVLRGLFINEPGLPPQWRADNEADERTIMPGLEHRVWQNRLRRAQAEE